MILKVETGKGWTEAIIDGDCEFVKFYRIADILKNDFDLEFTGELDDYDTIYKHFGFTRSKLTLCYNIYLGISIFPAAFKESSDLDNEHVLEIGQLLFDKVIDLDWEPFDCGSTIGKPGTEGGETIIDLESLNGGRITLEKNSGTIPFAITLGIYGLLMHTHFEGGLDEAMAYVKYAKYKINKIFDMYDVEEERRSDFWQTKLYTMIDELAEMAG